MHYKLINWLAWVVQAWLPLPPAMKIWCKHKILGQPAWSEDPSALARAMIRSAEAGSALGDTEQESSYDLICFADDHQAAAALALAGQFESGPRKPHRIFRVLTQAPAEQDRRLPLLAAQACGAEIPSLQWPGFNPTPGSEPQSENGRNSGGLDHFQALCDEHGILEAFCYVDEPRWLPHAQELRRRFHWTVGFDARPGSGSSPAGPGHSEFTPLASLHACDLLITAAGNGTHIPPDYRGPVVTLPEQPAPPTREGSRERAVAPAAGIDPYPRAPAEQSERSPALFGGFDRIEPVVRSLYRKASIVMVTCNGLPLNRLALRSILKNTVWPNYELIIIDNGSQDGTREFLRGIEARHSQVRVFHNPVNEGFARGTNRGIRAATGHYVVPLNNDTIVTRGWLGRLIRHLESDSSIAMVGPVTNSTCNEAKIHTDYTTLAGLERFAAERARKFRGQTIPVSMLALFCVVMRRGLFDEVGFLDERYELGTFEDDDLAMQVRNRGYAIRCAEDVFVHHFGKGTFKQMSEREYQQIFDANRKRFESKWKVRWYPQNIRTKSCSH
ncbi:MAG: hypothetical protein AUK55_05775 [Syntrophobacteraceae bacterium CG2_30_61_12]|nr:MAG: hypothetical protein AUK55_05775 [Syntrophobacteraceae bacterium CG2_30_61_12]